MKRILGTMAAAAALLAAAPGYARTPVEVGEITNPLLRADGGATPRAETRSDKQQIKDMQAALKAEGLYTGAVDGLTGPMTLAALKKYEANGGDVSAFGFAAVRLLEVGRSRIKDEWAVWRLGGERLMAPVPTLDIAFPKLAAQKSDDRSRKIREAIARHAETRPAGWDEKIAEIRAIPGAAMQAVEVQKWLSKAFPYVSDTPANEWKSPAEAFAQGGDCDDYAIAKMAALYDLGFAEGDVTLLSLGPRFDDKNHHVVTAFRSQGRAYVLEMHDPWDRLIPMEAYDKRGLVWAGNASVALWSARSAPAFDLAEAVPADAGTEIVQADDGKWYAYADNGKWTDTVTLVSERHARVWLAKAAKTQEIMEAEAQAQAPQGDSE